MRKVLVAEQHKPIHRRVALKLIKTGMDTKQVIENFLRSDKLALAKSYPHFPQKGARHVVSISQDLIINKLIESFRRHAPIFGINSQENRLYRVKAT